MFWDEPRTCRLVAPKCGVLCRRLSHWMSWNCSLTCFWPMLLIIVDHVRQFSHYHTSFCCGCLFTMLLPIAAIELFNLCLPALQYQHSTAHVADHDLIAGINVAIFFINQSKNKLKGKSAGHLYGGFQSHRGTPQSFISIWDFPA